MKMIIEIDEDDYTMCQILAKEMCDTRMKLTDNLKYAISNGIPLDNLRAEIADMPKLYPFIDHIDTYVKEDDVLALIDKYRGESDTDG